MDWTQGPVWVEVDVWRRRDTLEGARLVPHQTTMVAVADGNGDDHPELVAAQMVAGQLNSAHHMVCATRIVKAVI
jgi:hypothetical protein